MRDAIYRWGLSLTLIIGCSFTPIEDRRAALARRERIVLSSSSGLTLTVVIATIATLPAPGRSALGVVEVAHVWK